MRTVILTLLFLGACTGSEPSSPKPPADVTEVLAEGQARAGVITSEEALFGGITAEGAVGDIKLYNSKVQFIIQSPREGHYYVQEGGGVIDADLVRPAGEPGRDMVEEWAPMFGFGRILNPTSIEIVADGSDGGAAVVRVFGDEVPLALAEGALETPGLFPNLGLELMTTYRLEPDSHLLEVVSRVVPKVEPVELAQGDILLGAPEISDDWRGAVGFGSTSGSDRFMVGFVSWRDDASVAILAAPDQQLFPNNADLIGALVASVTGFSEDQEVPVDEPFVYRRFWGVGPDLATLSDAWHDRSTAPSEDVTGVVSDPDGPVQGVRVHVLVDGSPYTVATTGSDGSWSAKVPAGSTVTTAIDGRGPDERSEFGYANPDYAPFAAPGVRQASLDAITPLESDPIGGRGLLNPGEGSTLAGRGFIEVSVADDAPFTARIAGGRGGEDGLFAGRSTNRAAFSTGGTVRVPVPEGEYGVVVHRGLRFTHQVEQVSVTAGQTVSIEAALQPAFDHDGWVLGDPHSHGSPSGDGEVSMEMRLLSMVSGGIQLHFGTDHDRLADYRPLASAMGMDPWMKSVVASEVSPPLRGHMNIYPIVPELEKPNHGSWPWWSEIPETTQQATDGLRERHGDGFILQFNHPLVGGVASSAGWAQGRIRKPEYWTEDVQAMELINKADFEDWVPLFLDLTARGYRIAPVGVTDSHSATSGPPGLMGTFYRSEAVSEEGAVTATLNEQTIASRGLFLDMDPLPGSTVSGGTLTVEALGAPYAQADTISVYLDGELVLESPGASLEWPIPTDSDHVVVVAARGNSPMEPLTGYTPVAIAGAIRVDADGDGFTPPLPPLDGL